MPGELDIFTIVMGLLGGLALFLYGIDMMSGALKIIAGGGLRKLLTDLTKNRVMAAFTGAFTTAVVNSSSVTTVLVVGFISAGLMSLTQSVGVIMGANIGSTITAQLVAFSITKYSLLMVAGGFGLIALGKKEKVKQIGTAVMGMGLLFFGMALMSDATKPLRTYQPFIDLMQQMDNPILGLLVGMVFTALVQSSAATTGIVIVLASDGFISLPAGIALAFGANVGTCVTAVLSSLGKPAEARRAAAVHVLFNVIGVLIWLPLIDHLADWVRAISPSYANLEGKERLAKEVPRQIANAHTLFNVVNTFLFIWFDRTFAKVATRLVPDRPIPLPESAKPLYLDPVYLKTPDLGADRIRLEIGHLGDLVGQMIGALRGGERGKPIDLELIGERGKDVEILSAEILDYARKLSEQTISEESGRRMQDGLEVVNQLRGIADTIATNLSALLREWRERQLTTSDETHQRFMEIHKEIALAFRLAVEASVEADHGKAARVIGMKPTLYADIRALAVHLGKRLVSSDANRIETYRLESRVLEILRRLYYFSKRMAKVVADDVEEVLDPIGDVIGDAAAAPPEAGTPDPDRPPDPPAPS